MKKTKATGLQHNVVLIIPKRVYEYNRPVRVKSGDLFYVAYKL